MRLCNILEPLLRLRIIRVLIGMRLNRKSTVRFLDISVASILVNSENLVVVFSLALLEF